MKASKLLELAKEKAKTNAKIAERLAAFHDEEACDHCQIHSLAAATLPRVECSWCGEELAEPMYLDYEDNEAVGQFNFFDENEELFYCRLFVCGKCDKRTAMMPTRVDYNGNHGTYYTGGPKYLTDDDLDAAFLKLYAEIKSDAEQWVRRLKDGENLDAWNIATWIRHAAEETLAKLLYKNGWKR